jgi:class 3 adenylate cyclase
VGQARFEISWGGGGFLHREFRSLLAGAKGSSEFAIVVNVDIRGFSAFSKSVDSVQVAVFIKKVYKRLIEDYFPSASFFKPTGDGLLIVLTHDEDNLREVLTVAVGASLKLVAEFPQLCAGDHMINFPVPDKVGVGIARGTVSKITSADKILDYSGAVLNLATRLMDLARPSGVVLDGAIGFDLLPDDLKQAFLEDSGIFLRGVAEQASTHVYYTKDYTRIPAAYKHPLYEVRWASRKDSRTLGELRKIGPRFTYRLEKIPRDPKEIKVYVRTPALGEKGQALTGLETQRRFYGFDYDLQIGKPVVSLQLDKLSEILQEAGVKNRMRVGIEITYPES